MTDMRISIAGVSFQNPVFTASGTFANGREISEYYDLSQLGAVCVKAITLAPREGNPPPRIAETPSGVLNSVGLQNSGVDCFLEHDLPFLRTFDTKIIANISGCSVEENVELARRLGDKVDMLELNISCPNVKQGGVAFGTDPAIAGEITRAVKKAARVPLIVKLSPNVTDICRIARAAEQNGADALSLINTLLGMKIDIHTRRPVLRNNTGGLSGPAIRPVAVRMVWQVFQAVHLPIIAMGGIMSGEDAAEMMIAGAAAVAVGTANMTDPLAALRIKNELSQTAKALGASRITELTGTVRAY